MDYFGEIVGQERALSRLKKSLQTLNISHAYLFAGPSGVGKYTAARAFARSIIVAGDPGGETLFGDQVHPDFMVVEKAEDKTLIGIEQITAGLEPWLAYKPYRCQHRVAIIRDAHLLSLAAANALLKTLEEPPGYAVVVLVADENNLLETIVSRCQLIRFVPVADAGISNLLQMRGVDALRAEHLARLAQGSIARALKFAEEESWERLWQISQDLIRNMASGQDIEVFDSAAAIEEKPEIISSFIQAVLRDIYIYQSTGQEQLLAIPGNIRICRDFKTLSAQRVKKALYKIDELSKLYRSSVNSLLISINISYELSDALK